MIYPLKGSLQNYAWGSGSYIQELIGISTPEPLAELWLGAHHKAPARINGQTLDAFLKAKPHLAGTSYSEEQPLPYLMKVLAAQKPLSIQVHPNKDQALAGFERENKQGLPLDDPKRNYRDANHKLELICALTPFEAMCGFRAFDRIAEALQTVGLSNEVAACRQFCAQPDPQSWKECFAALLSLESVILAQTLENIKRLDPSTWAREQAWIEKLTELYPQDCGVLAPLYLNLVQLQPLEALFLDAGTPHAYLQGAGIEVMTASDNVLRAGLTSKHIDLCELSKVLVFQPLDVEVLKLNSSSSALRFFSHGAHEFKLGYAPVNAASALDLRLDTPAIILCIEGRLNCLQKSSKIELRRGEAAFCDAGEQEMSIAGEGAFFVVM